MPLDASIPYEAIRGLQKAPPYDPIAVQTDIDRQRVYQAASQKAQQQMAEQADLQQLAQQYGNDYDGLIDAAAKHGHTEWALDIGKKLQDGRAAGAQQRWEQTRASRAEIQSDLAEMQGQDATTWPDYSQKLAKKYPQLAPAILRPFSPQLIQQLAGIGQSQDQWLQSIETGAKSVADGKTLKGFADAYAGADTPEKRAAVDQMADSMKAAGMKTYFPDATSAQAWLEKNAKQSPEKAANIGSFEDYVVRTYGPNPTPDQIIAARKKYGQADDKAVKVSVAGGAGPAGGQSDVKETVAGMIDGTLPPVLPGRATKEYNAIMAESHRQKFDLAKAAQDWQATTKYMGTLNGAQQVRLRQATEQVAETVPLVRSLVTEWDSAGIPLLSAANLKAAKAGTFGNKAQSLANRLDAQIADLTSELGTVYKGGNSSTDESLKLAARNLGADWSKKAALDALDQIEKNIKYRRNSMKLGPVTGEGNRYAPDLGARESTGGGPKVGERRSFGGGKIGEWDGKGWKPVQ